LISVPIVQARFFCSPYSFEKLKLYTFVLKNIDVLILMLMFLKLSITI
jgi:hypothetical protein